MVSLVHSVPPYSSSKKHDLKGFHLHFITSALDAGGHVLGFDLESGRVELDEMPQLNLALPDSDDFRHAKLAVEEAELEEAERKR
jgi:acetolactate decarboxylase